jgi:hypothetical protein
MKTQDLHVGDLDLSWTAERNWTLHGPHAVAARERDVDCSYGRPAIFDVVVTQQHSHSLSG